MSELYALAQPLLVGGAVLASAAYATRRWWRPLMRRGTASGSVATSGCSSCSSGCGSCDSAAAQPVRIVRRTPTTRR